MLYFGEIMGQIGTKWDKSGNFSDQRRQNVLKNARICSILDQSERLWAFLDQTDIRCYMLGIPSDTDVRFRPKMSQIGNTLYKNIGLFKIRFKYSGSAS